MKKAFLFFLLSCLVFTASTFAQPHHPYRILVRSSQPIGAHIWKDWYVVTTDAESGNLALDNILDQSGVLDAELDGTYSATGNCAEWFLENNGELNGSPNTDIDADEAQAILQSSALTPTRIAVADSGIDTTHSYFKGVQFHADKAFDDPGTPAVRDHYGHGTPVTGVIVRVLGDRKDYYSIGSYRVFDAGGYTQWSVLVAAMKEAVEVDHCQVLNFSGAGSSPAQIIDDFIKTHPETLFVFSAGNYNGPLPYYPAGYSNMYNHVISVAAVDRRDALTEWTNRHATVVGPGETIYSCVPPCNPTPVSICSSSGTMFLDGTSFSSPIVAAIGAGPLARVGLPCTASRQMC